MYIRRHLQLRQFKMAAEDVNRPELEEAEIEKRCGLSPSTWKTLAGLVLVALIAISWVGTTQLATSTYSPDYNAPFFTTWFLNIWTLTVYVLFLMPSLAAGQKFQDILQDSLLVFGQPEERQVRRTVAIISFFSIVAIVTNYLYIRALGVIAPADVTAIFSSSNAFVYVFSFIWLREKFSFLRTFAVVFSITGIVLISYAEGFDGSNGIGVLLTVISAIGASLYKVLFKYIIGDASGRQVALFLSLVGAFKVFVLWPVALIFWLTDYEIINGANIPWAYLCGTGTLAMMFNFLINFGIAFTFPLFISLGTVIGIPTNALADFIFRGKDFGPYKIVAAIFIVLGFLLMLVPLKYEKKFLKRFCCFNSARPGEQDLKETGEYSTCIEENELKVVSPAKE